jgi:F-type H+-transporting ATPase subunit a
MDELERGMNVSVGSVLLRESVLTTWGILLLLGLVSWTATRRLSLEPKSRQVVLEGVVGAIEDAIAAVLPDRARELVPFVGTLWIFVAVANLLGVVPGLSAPTADLSVTAALAVIVFLSVHFYGIRNRGLGRYLRHYLSPNPVLLPFHLIGEVTRTLALALRLFGNIMSLELTAMLVLLVAGFLAPVPVLMLHIVEALVQAYIFGMLALIYVAGAIQSQELRRAKEESHE